MAILDQNGGYCFVAGITMDFDRISRNEVYKDQAFGGNVVTKEQDFALQELTFR
ncbi:hypothetical protein BGZ93_003698 [Podila epicladia]|nr:hypothetical protein BGZ93_003698 [Podila epicladia]